MDETKTPPVNKKGLLALLVAIFLALAAFFRFTHDVTATFDTTAKLLGIKLSTPRPTPTPVLLPKYVPRILHEPAADQSTKDFPEDEFQGQLKKLKEEEARDTREENRPKPSPNTH